MIRYFIFAFVFVGLNHRACTTGQRASADAKANVHIQGEPTGAALAL
jgi:hypothetical protein